MTRGPRTPPVADHAALGSRISHDSEKSVHAIAVFGRRVNRTRPARRFAAIGGMMAIEHIMSRQVVTVQLDDTLKQVRDLFAAFRFHHLLVLEHGKLVGIISDRDLLANVSPFIGKMQEKPIDLASLQKHVHQIMSRHVVTVTPSTSLQDAAKLMLDRGISCLPVVDAEGHVVGIVTWRDLLRGAYGIEPAKTAA